jgi:hypothetical protein
MCAVIVCRVYADLCSPAHCPLCCDRPHAAAEIAPFQHDHNSLLHEDTASTHMHSHTSIMRKRQLSMQSNATALSKHPSHTCNVFSYMHNLCSVRMHTPSGFRYASVRQSTRTHVHTESAFSSHSNGAHLSTLFSSGVNSTCYLVSALICVNVCTLTS